MKKCSDLVTPANVLMKFRPQCSFHLVLRIEAMFPNLGLVADLLDPTVP